MASGSSATTSDTAIAIPPAAQYGRHDAILLHDMSDDIHALVVLP
jgi:hypothetical protein